PGRIGLRAGVAVVADRVIGLGDGVAAVGGLVAYAVVARIGGRGAAPWRSPADALRAGVVHGAEEAVVAERPVGLRGVGAGAGARGTDAGRVARVEGGADDAPAAGADPRPAGVGLRAGVAVVARQGDVLVDAAGRRDARVRRADVAVVAVGWRATDTRAPRARVVRRASVAVAARRVVVHVQAAELGVAEVVGARVPV